MSQPYTHPFGNTITCDTLQQTFDACRAWDERYRQLILLAKQLPVLPEAMKTDQVALSGCENRVWLGYEKREDGTLHFYGESDGRIVRGLLAVLLTSIEGKRADELAGQDPLALFDKLGLRAQLSTSRAAGLAALAQRIQEIATQAR